MSGLWVYFIFQDNAIMLDSLTDMNNRRYFDKNLEVMTQNFDKLTDRHLWLILADVDYFKKSTTILVTQILCKKRSPLKGLLFLSCVLVRCAEVS
ncbi:MAG: diguanylate cyclase [Clostridia bacterium]|nr:diguanylate cyclase [Clostridia bacterium]